MLTRRCGNARRFRYRGHARSSAWLITPAKLQNRGTEKRGFARTDAAHIRRHTGFYLGDALHQAACWLHPLTPRDGRQGTSSSGREARSVPRAQNSGAADEKLADESCSRPHTECPPLLPGKMAGIRRDHRAVDSGGGGAMHCDAWPETISWPSVPRGTNEPSAIACPVKQSANRTDCEGSMRFSVVTLFTSFQTCVTN